MPGELQFTPSDIQQTKAAEPDGNGNLHDVYTVHFTTPSGTRTYVKVPDTQYTAHNVAQLMHHHMTHIEGVHALDGVPISPAVEPVALRPAT